jgi:hypothetical protein
MGQEDELPEACPPDGHWPARGVFYRLTRPSLKIGEVPEDKDWVLPLHTKKSAAYLKHDECDAYSYSLFDDIEPLHIARLASAWARRKSISRVILPEGSGYLLKTESELADGHHDWWPVPAQCIPGAVVVEERAA